MRRDVTAIVLCIVALVLVVTMSAPPAALAAPGPNIQGDPQAVAELTAVYRKFGEAKSWRSRMLIPGQTPPVTHTVAFVAPDRLHITLTQGTTTTEFFIIGTAMWAKSGGTQQASDASPAAQPT